MMEDKIKGMVIGSILGDALGFPHEFNTKHTYTGKLEFQPIVRSRFQGTKTYNIGQTSDDTDMSLILIHSLIKHKKYIKDEVCLDYMRWASGIVDDRVLQEGEDIN